MTSFGSLPILLLAGVLASSSSLRAQADESKPAWFKKKSLIQQQKAEDEAAKAAEKPVVGASENSTSETSEPEMNAKIDGVAPAAGTASDLSGKDAPVDTRTLFTKRGVTDSLGLDYGTLRQPVINGNFLSAQYGLGWWWTPRLTLGLFARSGMMLKNEYLFMMVALGPQLRYFATKNLAVTGFGGYSFTQGLSRVPSSHIPTPPSTEDLRARRGLIMGAQIAWMFWSKRDLAIGPAINYWHGTSNERTFSMVSFGITYQSGKPNLTGSVMEDY